LSCGDAVQRRCRAAWPIGTILLLLHLRSATEQQTQPRILFLGLGFESNGFSVVLKMVLLGWLFLGRGRVAYSSRSTNARISRSTSPSFVRKM